MTMLSVLPVRGESFVDARGADRTLRVSWHPDRNAFVLSIWHDTTCVASFQLDSSDAAGLVAGITAGLVADVTGGWSSTSYAALVPTSARTSSAQPHESV